jgi:UDP-GlcNAc:undecaprenyl-phosphate/decaprenyl-phosphate GlcNAc-1-phosphate transferase
VPDELTAWQASVLAFGVAAAVVLAARPRRSAPATPPAAADHGVRRLEQPPLGGISILLAVLVASLAFLPLAGVYRGILIGAVAISIAGIVADVRGLPTLVMFGAQVGAAGIAVGYGVSIDRFTFPFVGVVAELPSWADVPLTITWIVVLMRLVDFVDGLDGLAAGICGAAAVTFVVLALGLEDRGAAVLSAIVAGACSGFLFRNFYPSRILLGHVGSLVLGYLVGTVAVAGLLKTAAVVGVLFPFLVLAVPALDSSFAVATRLVSRVDPRATPGGRPPAWSRRRVVAVLSAWCAVVGASVLASNAIGFRAHGEWHPWRTLVVAALGTVVLAGSVYVIGLIESSRLARRRAPPDQLRRITPQATERPPLAAPEQGVEAGMASPAAAIHAARSSRYGSARRRTDVALRLLDVGIAGVALIVLAPVLALVACLVLVTSGRPVLHAGSRVGREGHIFTMRKIRTLKPDAEMRLGPFYGAELDRRMSAETTRIGRILRATHLDETPQLWNVLVGDMSVVGPRPLRPRFFEELCAEIPQYWQRLTIRPGLTGLAQTRIDRGAGWDEKLSHDLEWIADRSVKLYLVTVVVTAWRVLVATVTLRWRHASSPAD